MIQTNPIQLLRQLKGAPLSVLLALFWVNQRVTAGWLETVTGYTDKPVSHALDLLKEYGWATRVQGGWMIANAEQLPLMEVRNNSDSSSSSIGLINNLNINQEEEEVRKNSDFSANLIALLTGGIREPKASTLADLEHVSPEYISAHLKQTRRDGFAIGTAIYRIENNWEMPAIVDDVPATSKYSESEYFGEVFDRGRDDDPH